MDSVRPFVASCAAAGGADLRRLTAGDVTAFLTGESRRLAPKTAQRLATALRSLLRFWHVEGLISGPLDRAVPKVANRRPGLPRPLEPAQVRALLASCDRGTAGGRRDLAMMTLLARMGLRAGEVAGLRLDDIDWRRGEITIAGKGNRRDRLPLPADAGEAVADWLRHGRPPTALDRSVFIRIKAPHQGLTAAGSRWLCSRPRQRAGLGVIYAHRLRHTAATAMLAEGGSLAEIGQVLRHRRPRPRRHTRRSTSRRCARSPAHGRGVVVTGLRQALAGYLDLRRGLGFKLDRDAKLLDQFIAYLEQRGTEHGHRDRRAGLGHAARRRQPGLAADADHRGPRLRRLPRHPRPVHRSPPGQPAAGRNPPGRALPVLRRRHRCAACPGGAAEDAAAPGDHQDPDRPDDSHRHARRRSRRPRR